MRAGAPAAALGYAAAALLYMAPAFAPDRQLLGTDYTAAGYMVMEYVARLLAAGRLPTWLPHLMGGVPVFANPGSIFHPVRLLLALVLPAERVPAALFAVYFAVAGFGMYALLRTLAVRRSVAFVVGLAFEFTGSLASLLYAGHDGRFIVAASTPLALALLARGVRTGQVKWFAGLAAVVGTALLSFQIQSAYYLLLLALAWGVFVAVGEGLLRRPRVLAVRAGLGVAAVALGFALAAVDLLPFAGYVDASPRGVSAGRDYRFATSFSMPPVETLGIAVPEQAGVLDDYHGANPLKYHTEYLGALVVALAGAGLALCARDRRWRFFAVTAVIGLTVAWGGFTPLYEIYYAVLPGLAKFRAPGLAFAVVALAVAAMAGLALEALAARHDLREAARHALRGAGGHAGRLVAMLAGLPLLIGIGERLNGPATAAAGAGWLRFGIALLVVVGLLALWTRAMLSTRHAMIALGVVGVLDLWVIDRQFFILDDPPGRMYAADDVVEFLRAQPDVGAGRVWFFPTPAPDGRHYLGNARFGLNTNYFMHFGLNQLGGEHGNQLRRWNEYLGVDSAQHIDWHNVMQSMPMASAAAVRYAVATVDLSKYKMNDGRILPSGFRRVYGGSAAVFRNDSALARATLVPAVEVAPAGGALALMRRKTWNPRRTAIVEAPLAMALPGGDPDGTADVVRDDGDRLVVRTASARPNVLVVADNFYPGWTARVDGTPAPVYRVDHTLRGVPVPAGRHEVRLVFQPVALYRGLWISLAAAAALVLCVLGALAWPRLRRPREATSVTPDAALAH